MMIAAIFLGLLGMFFLLLSFMLALALGFQLLWALVIAAEGDESGQDWRAVRRLFVAAFLAAVIGAAMVAVPALTKGMP